MKTGEERHSHSHGGKSSEALLNKKIILEHLCLASGQTVLDAGCGNGYMTKEFSKCVGENGFVFALDPHAPSVETLSRETEGMNIEVFVGDITRQTKLAASSIDLIYLSTVFHGFSAAEIPGFVEEAKRLLKPNGMLAIVEIVKDQTPFGPPLDMRFSSEELIQAIGLKAVGCFDVGEFFYLQLFNNRKGQPRRNAKSVEK